MILRFNLRICTYVINSNHFSFNIVKKHSISDGTHLISGYYFIKSIKENLDIYIHSLFYVLLFFLYSSMIFKDCYCSFFQCAPNSVIDFIYLILDYFFRKFYFHNVFTFLSSCWCSSNVSTSFLLVTFAVICF